MAHWNNRENKAQIEERLTLPLDRRQALLFFYRRGIDQNLFYDFFCNVFCQKLTSIVEEVPIFPLLLDKQYFNSH